RAGSDSYEPAGAAPRLEGHAARYLGAAQNRRGWDAARDPGDSRKGGRLKHGGSMITPNGGQSFSAEYGPIRFETLALGLAGGVLLAARVGVGLVALVALGAAIASYVIRRYITV